MQKTLRIFSLAILSLFAIAAFAQNNLTINYTLGSGKNISRRSISWNVATLSEMYQTTSAAGVEMWVVQPKTGLPSSFQIDKISSMRITQDYVEIGGVKWATMNLGATTVAGDPKTCYGDYFAAGETFTRYDSKTVLSASEAAFTWKDEYYKGYHSYLDHPVNTLDAEHDAAQAWGSDWYTPTQEDFQKLYDACGGATTPKSGGTTSTTAKGIYWCNDYDGVAGLLFSDGVNQLFFPAAGMVDDATLQYGGTSGFYWSSTPFNGISDVVSHLTFSSSAIKPAYDAHFYEGFVIRPVLKPEHDYVDLGLSVKWAKCNIGAQYPNNYGDYIAWGETEGYKSGKTNFDWVTYKLTDNGVQYFYYIYKYTIADGLYQCCWYQDSVFVGDNKTTLEACDDVATVMWGEQWRMPTQAEWEELYDPDNCQWVWGYENGAAGYKVYSKKEGYTKNYVFFPFNGAHVGTSTEDVGKAGCYWSSTLTPYLSNRASAMYIEHTGFNQNINNISRVERSTGLGVRPVRK